MYGDNVLVVFDHHRQAREDVTTRGGIIIPQTARTPGRTASAMATVVRCRPRYYDRDARRELETPFRAGDRVLVDCEDQGDRLLVGDVEHRIIKVHNVVAVVDE